MEKLKVQELNCGAYTDDLRIVAYAVNRLITDSEAKDKRLEKLEEAVRYLASELDDHRFSTVAGAFNAHLFENEVTEILTK